LPRLEWFGEASTEASRRLDHAHIDHTEPPLLKRRPVRLAVLLLVSAAALAASAGAASAKTSCGVQVIDDWYGSKTGQLSKIYPLHCYRDALKIVDRETDILVYSNAKSDITRAMALAAAFPGGGPKNPTTSPDHLPSFLGGPDKRNGGRPPGSLISIGPKRPGGVPGLFHSSSASSVPLPAIVLGAIAALLLALGSTAYLARRRQLRRQTLRPRHANGRNP
jgi:hypothetical protein